MRFVPTLIHGVIDYLVGLLLIALPFMLGLQGVPRMLLLGLAAAVLLYSFCTDYELGAVRYLRIRFHLLLDAAFGIFMLLLPSLFSFTAGAAAPIYLIGGVAVALVFTTEVRAIGTASSDNYQGNL